MPVMLHDIVHPIYQVGQIWAAPTPLNPQGYAVVILRLEHDNRAGALAHVRIEGVHIPLPNMPHEHGDTVGHAPFTLEALGRSNLSNTGHSIQLSSADLEGYHTWRAAFDKNESGVFQQTVQEAVDGIAQSMLALRQS
jgi:hypothetical protein